MNRSHIFTGKKDFLWILNEHKEGQLLFQEQRVRRSVKKQGYKYNKAESTKDAPVSHRSTWDRKRKKERTEIQPLGDALLK